MNAYRMTAAALVFVLAMAVAAPAWAVGEVGAQFTVEEAPNYSLEISAGQAQSFLAQCGNCAVGEDIVVTNTGNRGVFLNMVADTLPTDALGNTLSFALGEPAANQLAWAIIQHRPVDAAPVFVDTTVRRISDGAMAPTEVFTYHSKAMTGIDTATPGTYSWTATIIATDENAPN